MCPVIEISDELFMRLQANVEVFGDTPASVIERLLNKTEAQKSNSDVNSKETEEVETNYQNSTNTTFRLKVNPKIFLKNSFPELLQYKRSSSRMYEKKENKNYKDCWWFNFSDEFLVPNSYVIFVGALDYKNKGFRIFKVPTNYLIENISKIDITSGWVHLYIHFSELIDLRNKSNLSFKEFVLN
jgi:hypothetical protein